MPPKPPPARATPIPFDARSFLRSAGVPQRTVRFAAGAVIFARLARTLLLLARYGKEDTTPRALPQLSQETLAEMVGTTRSRVTLFMNKFRKLGLIEYNGGLKVNSSLLSIVLHE